MKKLSDYVGEDAIDLWADLLTPLSHIITDKSVQRTIKAGGAPITIVRDILKNCKKDAMDILQRVDNEPVDGLNIVTRMVMLVQEIRESKEFAGFFGVQSSAVDSQKTSSGNVTESTKGDKT